VLVSLLLAVSWGALPALSALVIVIAGVAMVARALPKVGI
jgi:hypothetical protein